MIKLSYLKKGKSEIFLGGFSFFSKHNASLRIINSKRLFLRVGGGAWRSLTRKEQNRDMFWKVLEKFGCPEIFVKMTRAFHTGMMTTVLVTGEKSGAFGAEMRNGSSPVQHLSCSCQHSIQAEDSVGTQHSSHIQTAEVDVTTYQGLT